MDSRLIYSAAAAALDSWDLENLKYLRKISQSNNNNNGQDVMEKSYCETMSYQSSNGNSLLPTDHAHGNDGNNNAVNFNESGHFDEVDDTDEDRSLEFTTTRASVHCTTQNNSNNFDTISLRTDTDTIVQKSHHEDGSSKGHSRNGKLHEVVEFSPHFGHGMDKSNIVSNSHAMNSHAFDEVEPTSLTLLPRPLDTCYQLDILTIRNESVLANKHPNVSVSCTNTNPAKFRNGSDGFSSSGESSSFDEGNFFDGAESCDGESGSGHGHGKKKSKRLSSTSSSHSSTSLQSTIVQNERTAICPFCDGVGARLTSSRTYYYMGENESGNVRATTPPTKELASAYGVVGNIVNTAGNESPPPLPRTPSPYYVRLRRDLVTSYSPALCPPRNFGMDKQGQLVIDYSQNWIGLEKYVENLKLS